MRGRIKLGDSIVELEVSGLPELGSLTTMRRLGRFPALPLPQWWNQGGEPWPIQMPRAQVE